MNRDELATQLFVEWSGRIPSNSTPETVAQLKKQCYCVADAFLDECTTPEAPKAPKSPVVQKPLGPTGGKVDK